MVEPLLFGGRSAVDRVTGRCPAGALDELTGSVCWKYAEPQPRFPDIDSAAPPSVEELAHWAGRVWFHENPMPSGESLHTFDLRTLQAEYTAYVQAEGMSSMARGMTLEEIWASQQLHDARERTLMLNRDHADQPTARVDSLMLEDADILVWILALHLLELDAVDPVVNALVTDGKAAHTIVLSGVNPFDYVHPRGVDVEAGWFSFHDPWPARSLLAPEHDFSGSQVLEDVARPPFWLISPADLERVLVGFLLPTVTVLDLAQRHGPLLDLEAGLRRRGRGIRPMWREDPARPELAFPVLFDALVDEPRIVSETLLGLGAWELLAGNDEGALDWFADAAGLEPGSPYDPTALMGWGLREAASVRRTWDPPPSPWPEPPGGPTVKSTP